MRKSIKWFLLVTTIIIFSLVINHKLNYNKVKVPKSDDFNNITFINVINGRGVEKRTIYKKLDINKLLDILENSKKINKDSVSNLPDKDKFTIITFEMVEGGYVINSIYEENNHFYLEQPYYGIFELDSENIYSLINRVREKDNKQNISVNIEDILKGNF